MLNIFSSTFLLNNFKDMVETMETYALDKERFYEFSTPIYHGMMTGDNAQAHGVGDNEFYTIADALGYNVDNMSHLVAFQFGFYVGMFHSLSQAAEHLVVEEEDYQRLSSHLKENNMGNISAEQLQRHSMNITYALAFIDSYVE